MKEKQVGKDVFFSWQRNVATEEVERSALMSVGRLFQTVRAAAVNVLQAVVVRIEQYKITKQ
jgi:hypothetical protein